MPKPVVYIPGFPASHIRDRQTAKKVFLSIPGLVHPGSKKRILKQLEAPSDLTALDPLVAGEPIRLLAKFLFFDLAKQADSLYDILKQLGIRSVNFGWDWRRPVYDPGMQQQLKETIRQQNRVSGEKVTIIVHSTGGLVLRRLLESHRGDSAFLDQIERVIAIGVPWAGTLKSFVSLTGDQGFSPFLSKAQIKRLLSMAWAAYDLLPPDPARTPMQDAAGRALRLVVDGNNRQVGPLIKRGWFDRRWLAEMNLRADGADSELGKRRPTLELGGHRLPIANLVGWGEETTIRAVITGSANQQTVSYLEEKGDDLLGGGDGTVPRVSAAWLRGPDVTTLHVPVGVDHSAKMSPHSTLWRTPGGRNLLRHLLDNRALKPFVYGAVDDEDSVRVSVANVRVRLVALDANGKALPNATVQAVDLKGGPSPSESFDPVGEGRHLVRVPRNLMPLAGNQHRRFTLQFRWREAGVERSLERAYFVAK